METVNVPPEMQDVFKKAEDLVQNYFSTLKSYPSKGIIDISGERYILVRAASMSVEFFDVVKNLYQDISEERANQIAFRMLFDVSHKIGKQDAKTYKNNLGARNNIEIFSVGPISFAYSGWARVEILPESKVTNNDNYYLIYDHPNSFESYSWIKNNKQTSAPICVINSGYSSGWCEETFGIPLIASEIMCRAKGDDRCRFIMAPPSKMERYIKEYVTQNIELNKDLFNYKIPKYFKKIILEKELRKTEKRLQDDELKLTKSQEKYQLLVENIPSVLWKMNAEGVITFISKNVEKICGFKDEEVYSRGRDVCIERVHPDDCERVKKYYQNLYNEEKKMEIEYRIKRKDGKWIWLHELTNVIFDKNGEKAIYGIFSDITSSKKMELKLLKSEKEIKSIYESTNEEINKHNKNLSAIREINKLIIYSKEEQSLFDNSCKIIVDLAGYDLAWIGFVQKDKNKTIVPISWSGVSQQWIEKMKPYLTWANKDYGKTPMGICVRTGTSNFKNNLQKFKIYNTFPSKHDYSTLISLPLKDDHEVFGVLNIYSKIYIEHQEEEKQLLEEMANNLAFGIQTLKKQSELDLRLKFENTTKNILNNLTSVTKDNIDECIDQALQKISEVLMVDHLILYKLTNDYKFISATHEWQRKDLQPHKAFLQNIDVAPNKIFMKDLLKQKYISYKTYAEIPKKHGSVKLILTKFQLESFIGFPVIYRGRLEGLLTLACHRPNISYNEVEREFLSTAAEIFGGTLTKKELFAREEQYILEQHDALINTVQAISLAIEQKDPYTAGHQRRVAELSVAIANEMNLSKTEVERIRLGALVHDIGKISVPSEMLTKPGNITDVEMAIIKLHPQNGYNIIKDIKVPWPIKDIVLNHHERLDGSGYPKGKKAEEISIYCRIVSVADVVEAMMSHRPYRATEGLKTTLEEINKHKGTLYDPIVVRICTDLFLKKNFKFQETANNSNDNHSND